MGFLKNLISNAVSEGVGSVKDGIGKGITDAVGKAVETAVKPAADKLAQQTANQLDRAAKTTEEAAKTVEENETALGWLLGDLQAAARKLEEAGARPESDEAAAADAAARLNWPKVLPNYPLWDQGGQLELDVDDELFNGYPVIHLSVFPAGEDQVNAYVETLKAAGFVPKHGEVDDDMYRKEVGGVLFTMDKTDCLMDGGARLAFFVDK